MSIVSDAIALLVVATFPLCTLAIAKVTVIAIDPYLTGTVADEIQFEFNSSGITVTADSSYMLFPAFINGVGGSVFDVDSLAFSMEKTFFAGPKQGTTEDATENFDIAPTDAGFGMLAFQNLEGIIAGPYVFRLKVTQGILPFGSVGDVVTFNIQHGKQGIDGGFHTLASGVVGWTVTGPPTQAPTGSPTVSPATEALLQNLGLSGCNPRNICNACQGDCDSDSDCALGTMCFQRSAQESVPGCASGGSGDIWSHDYCYVQACPSFTTAETCPSSNCSWTGSKCQVATYVVQTGKWCGGSWGMQRKALADHLSTASCAAEVLSDSECGDTFYYCGSVKHCRCVLPGQTCTMESGDASCVVSRVGQAVPTLAPTDAPTALQYRRISSGTCAFIGMASIIDIDSCIAAGTQLGLLDTTVHSECAESTAGDFSCDDRPSGCVYADNDGLTFNAVSTSHACGTTQGGRSYDCFCQKACYSSLSYVATDEGGQLEEVPYVSVLACEEACNNNPLCNSFTICPLDYAKCVLKDKIITGVVPQKIVGDCKTYYRSPCGQQASFSFFQIIHEHTRCQPNSWLHVKDESEPEKCFAEIMLRESCSKHFFNYVQDGGGNCGCILDLNATCSTGLVSVDGGTAVYQVLQANSCAIDSPSCSRRRRSFDCSTSAWMRQNCQTECSAEVGCQAPVPIYHRTNSDKSANMYCANCRPDGYVTKSIAFQAYIGQVDGTVPIYRHYWSKSSKVANRDNRYTTETVEDGYRNLGVAFYAYPSQMYGSIPIHEYHHRGTVDHDYTVVHSDRLGNGWEYQGVAFYAYPPQAITYVEVTSGLCLVALSEDECRAISLQINAPDFHVKEFTAKYPPGCVQFHHNNANNLNMIYNKDTRGNADKCKSANTCFCKEASNEPAKKPTKRTRKNAKRPSKRTNQKPAPAKRSMKKRAPAKWPTKKATLAKSSRKKTVPAKRPAKNTVPTKRQVKHPSAAKKPVKKKAPSAKRPSRKRAQARRRARKRVLTWI